MPDVVLYREDKNWIYFVESVTSVGPMDSKRILEINEMTKNVVAGKIFVTAFLDFKTYKRFSENLAWETEVWIAEMPEHMIHLNGDKFLGPRQHIVLLQERVLMFGNLIYYNKNKIEQQFTHIYYLAVVCDDAVLEERMRKGRRASNDDWIRNSTDFNKWLKQQPNENVSYPITLLDTSGISSKQAAAMVDNWIMEKNL